LQARRLRIAQALAKELETFQVKITAAANETFRAWREGRHDNLVLAVAVAAWQEEQSAPFFIDRADSGEEVRPRRRPTFGGQARRGEVRRTRTRADVTPDVFAVRPDTGLPSLSVNRTQKRPVHLLVHHLDDQHVDPLLEADFRRVLVFSNDRPRSP